MSGVSLSPDTVACRGTGAGRGTNLWLGPRTRVRAESRDWGDDGGGPAGLGKMKRRAAVWSCTCRCVLEQNFVTCQIGSVRRGSKMCARVKLGLRSPTPSFHLRRRHASTPSRDNNADGLALGTCLDNTVHPCPPAVVQASHDVESHEIGR